MTPVTKRVLLSGMAAAALALGGPASAQSYPDKPVKMIVPFPPGGPIDTMARLVGQILTTGLGQQVVIENRPGAGATLGSKAVASAEPDGYTLLFGSSGSLAVAPAFYTTIDYDPIRMFTPVATVALLPHVFVVGSSVPAKTVGELIALAKANPGKLNYGAGQGTPPQMLGTLFKTRAAIDVVFIPYRGAAQSITDLLAGQTQFTIDALVVLLPLIKEGKLRPIAIARPQRWPELPDLPTLVESGFPDIVYDAWTGVVAPAGTPVAIVNRLNAMINDDLRTPEMKVNLAKFSAIAQFGTPQDFSAFLKVELPKWAEVVKLSGAKPE
jgi:tripartite-type tricarboxylate transporter receptor subunit TctC